MAIVDRVGFPMDTRDLVFFRVAQLSKAPLDKDPETKVLTIAREYPDGSAIFFQAQQNGCGEVVQATITNFNKATNKPEEPDEVVLENAHFRGDGRGGFIIVSQTSQGELGVKIPLGAQPEVFRPIANPR